MKKFKVKMQKLKSKVNKSNAAACRNKPFFSERSEEKKALRRRFSKIVLG
jgi:hypothetical protein